MVQWNTILQFSFEEKKVEESRNAWEPGRTMAFISYQLCKLVYFPTSRGLIYERIITKILTDFIRLVGLDFFMLWSQKWSDYEVSSLPFTAHNRYLAVKHSCCLMSLWTFKNFQSFSNGSSKNPYHICFILVRMIAQGREICHDFLHYEWIILTALHGEWVVVNQARSCDDGSKFNSPP